MRKKRLYFTIFIVFSLYLTACGSFQNQYPLQENIESKTAGQEAEIEQEDIEPANAEKEITQQAERRSELASALNEKLSVGNNGEEQATFVEWLLNTYGPEQLGLMDLSDDIDRQLYYVTGKSLHVLWDTSLGYLENEHTAAEHDVYLIEDDDTVADMAFAGDICLTEDGYVIDHYDALGGDIGLCLSEKIIDRLNEADISMINHEYPVSSRGAALEGKYYTFRASPERERILQQMGIDIVSLANNHIYDFGADAFYDTLDVLNQSEIPYVGAGADMEEASRPVYFVVGGIKIGFVAANRSEKFIFTPEAGENTPGVVRMYDTEMMNNIIKETHKQCDYLIAYVHWGTEDSEYYEAYQTAIAQEFFDSGADAIIGSHPHVLQGIGYVDEKPVVYSLGDFWFNGETKYTAIVNLKVTIDGLVELSVLPCIQEGYETHYISEESEQKAFYDYLR
ncbi:MAG: CapA family protein, partial [Acetatifactor sp.]|nr:CapA family protein [Acetatifactor sp.]